VYLPACAAHGAARVASDQAARRPVRPRACSSGGGGPDSAAATAGLSVRNLRNAIFSATSTAVDLAAADAIMLACTVAAIRQLGCAQAMGEPACGMPAAPAGHPRLPCRLLAVSRVGSRSSPTHSGKPLTPDAVHVSAVRALMQHDYAFACLRPSWHTRRYNCTACNPAPHPSSEKNTRAAQPRPGPPSRRSATRTAGSMATSGCITWP